MIAHVSNGLSYMEKSAANAKILYSCEHSKIKAGRQAGAVTWFLIPKMPYIPLVLQITICYSKFWTLPFKNTNQGFHFLWLHGYAKSSYFEGCRLFNKQFSIDFYLDWDGHHLVFTQSLISLHTCSRPQ